jgi:hypothetical protein
VERCVFTAKFASLNLHVANIRLSVNIRIELFTGRSLTLLSEKITAHRIDKPLGMDTPFLRTS